MSYELWQPTDEDFDAWSLPLDAFELWSTMERESHPLGIPILFRDEFGDRFVKLCSLFHEDGEFAGAVVRNEQLGYLYTTTDCEEWSPVKAKVGA